MSVHIPIRTCVGCFGKFPKGALIRVLRTRPGEIKIAAPQSEAGRGVYVCRNETCLRKAVQRKGRDAFSHSLKVKVAEEITSKLKCQMS